MDYSHVLISRPEPEATELEQMITGLGLEVLSTPAFAFDTAFPGLEFSTAWTEDERRLAIFSSSRAVEFGLRQLPAGFLDGVEISAIGPATATALEAAGYTVTIVPQGEFNSEALLLHAEVVNQPGKALIFAAPGGRQKLFTGLQEIGWEVQFAHVYRTVAIEPDNNIIENILKSRQVLSVWTSANALKLLSKTLDANAWAKICQGDFLVTSARLAKIAQDHAPENIYVTDGPGNDAIRNCIAQLI